MPTPVPTAFVALALLLLFCVSLLCALLPLQLSGSFKKDEHVNRLADTFAAGILASAAFVHLLPAATAKLTTQYPVAGALAILGVGAMHLQHALPYPNNSRTTNAFALVAALLVHAALEGLALGASASQRGTFAALLAAVLAHKAFVALSLGAALAGAACSHITATILAFTFSAISPLSACFALAFVRFLLKAHTAHTVAAALSAISAGVFAYVAFVDLLPHPSRQMPQPSLPKYDTIDAHVPLTPILAPPPPPNARAVEPFVFAAAAAAMAALALWA